MVVLFLSVLAAADFLDPPPCRRSRGDFIGRQTRWSWATCNQSYSTGYAATQYLYCVAQKSL